MLIMLYGASGVGKSHILNIIKKNVYQEVDIGKKYSTRARRLNDNSDMRVGLASIDTDLCDLVYSLYGYDYGIDTNEIIQSIKAGRIFIMVVQDICTIKKLKNKISKTTTIFVYRTFDKNNYNEIVQERGVNNQDKEVRIKSYSIIHNEYLDNIGLFDDVILNIGDINRLSKTTNHIIRKFHS